MDYLNLVFSALTLLATVTLGVIQITGNEPAQDTRGEVSGLSLTATWQLDPAVDGGNSRYLQSYAAA